MTRQEASFRIKEEAFRLGFGACGIAPAVFADTEVPFYDRWIASGYHAGMSYLTNHRTVRFDPSELVAGAKSVVCVALNYYPSVRQTPEAPRIAYYAYGRDYHEVMKEKLRALLEAVRSVLTETNGGEAEETPEIPGASGPVPASGPGSGSERSGSRLPEEARCGVAPPVARVFTDSAPILERYWAWRAGLGWIGKNTNLIVPGKGSYFFLGEIVIDRELAYDTPVRNRCGRCTRCLDACPTGALEKARCLNASKCLSYLTIEHRGPIPAEQAARLENRLFGCDTCQTVCPWNRFAVPTDEPAFQPNPELLALQRDELTTLTPEAYRRIFRHSAVKRAKYEGLMRTIGQWPDKDNYR